MKPLRCPLCLDELVVTRYRQPAYAHEDYGTVCDMSLWPSPGAFHFSSAISPYAPEVCSLHSVVYDSPFSQENFSRDTTFFAYLDSEVNLWIGNMRVIDLLGL